MDEQRQCHWCRGYHKGMCKQEREWTEHRQRVEQAKTLEAAQQEFLDAVARNGSQQELSSVDVLELIMALNEKLDATIRTLHHHGYEGQTSTMEEWGVE